MKKILYTLLVVVLAGTAIPVSALTISPARIEVIGQPGATLNGKIELFNEQEGTKTFFTSYENFEPSGDTGAPRFIGAKDGLATWIKSESKVVLGSGKRIEIPYSITIPANAEPGGYFAAVFFGGQEPGAEGGGQVSVGGKIGALILLRVAGEVEEGGGLLDFIAKGKQRFFSTLPIAFNYRINNTGGDRIVPKGEVKIKNILQITSATLLANKGEGSVLPGSTRKFEVLWGEQQVVPVNDKGEQIESSGFFEMAGRQLKDFHFGWYRAKIDLSWGETNQTAKANYNFFVIPWQLLIIVLLIIGIIVYFGKKALRKYNNAIIARAQK